MSYESERLVVEKKLRLVKRIVFAIVALIIATLCVLGGIYESSEWKYRVDLPKLTARTQGELRLHFISVGDGDCSFVEFPDGKTAIIDGGNGSGNTNKTVLRYLNALGVETIDFLFLTRLDSNCFGGFSGILRYKKVKTAYLPQTETENASYLSLLKQIKTTGISVQALDRSVHIAENGYTLSVLSPVFATDKIKNAVVWLGYAGVGALVSACATKDAETKLMQEDRLGAFDLRGVALKNTQIIKVALGGDKSATDSAFLRYLGARTAVISCGNGNALRPAKTTVATLQEVGVKAYRTDQSGNIIVSILADGAYTVGSFQK